MSPTCMCLSLHQRAPGSESCHGRGSREQAYGARRADGRVSTARILRRMEMTAFDPELPLPDMPDPWVSTSQPSRRATPPFHMTDMIEAEPAIAARILARHEAVGSGAAELARVIRRTVRSGDRVVVTGCGTSEHAALGVAEILRDAVRTADVRPPGHAARHEPVAAQAFELSLDPPSSGL